MLILKVKLYKDHLKILNFIKDNLRFYFINSKTTTITLKLKINEIYMKIFLYYFSFQNIVVNISLEFFQIGKIVKFKDEISIKRVSISD